MRRYHSDPRALVTAVLSAALLGLVLGLPLGPLGRVGAWIVGTPLLVALAEALHRLWPPTPAAAPAHAKRDSVADELLLGFELQQRFLPAETEASFGGLHLAGRCLPARGVSGDTFDFGALGEDRAMLLLADVAGKGIPAAILMAVFHSSFRSRIVVNAELAPLLEALNKQIHGLGGPNRYVTAFTGVFDHRTGRLDYVNAGHFPPILCRGGVLEQLEAGGMPLGMFENVYFETGVVEIAFGDVLVIYSDGVLEALNAAGEEFGRERLEALILRHQSSPVGKLRDLLFEALVAWNDDFIQEDDITVLVVRREPWPPAA